ncbi:MAG: TonB-dependent siderophore receptor [Chthoniobacter sp.]
MSDTRPTRSQITPNGFRASHMQLAYGSSEATPAEEDVTPLPLRTGPVAFRPDPAALFKGASAATVALAVILVPNADAEEPSTAASVQNLPEVVVRGQDENGYRTENSSLPKYTEPLRDIPQSISVVNQQVMQDQGVTTLRDALRNVSGISLAAGEGGSQGDNLTIRGFSARSDIFLDGMRDFGSYYRDPFNLQEVEVLQGPSSITFGRGSTGGVVNQVSKTPFLEQRFSGQSTFGTDRTKRGTLDFNLPITEIPGAALRLNMMANENGVAGREGALYQRWGIAPSLAFGIGTPTRLTLSYYHQTEDNLPDYGLPVLLSRPAPVSRSNFYGFKDGNNFLNTDVNIGTIKLEHDVNENLTLRDQVRYANYWRRAQITEPQIPATVTADTPLEDIQVTRNQITTQSLETQLQNQFDATTKFTTFGALHTLVGGIEYDHETSSPVRTTWAGVPTTSLLSPDDTESFSGIPTISSISKGTIDTFSLYAVDTIKLGKHWQLIGGVRWDRVDSEFSQTAAGVKSSFDRLDNLVSWRGGLVYKPVEYGSIYFAAGTSFNPSAEQLSLSAATANVAPEKNITYEIGTKWDLFDRRFSFTGALFWDEKTNARTTDPNDPLLNVLGGDQRAVGGSVGIIGRITENWQVTASYTHIDSKVVKSTTPDQVGNPLSNSPRNTFSLWTTYTTPWKLEVGAGADVVSGRTLSLVPDANTDLIRAVPGYVVFNAMAKYPITKNVDLQMNLNNIANKYYYDGLHPQHIIPGVGRTLLVSLAFKF